MSDDDELTREEMESLAPVLRWIWYALILLAFLAIAGQIYVGFSQWSPIWWIPIWAIIWFVLRVIQRLVFRAWISMYEELGWVEAPSQTVAPPSNLYDSRAKRAFPTKFKVPADIRDFSALQITLIVTFFLVISGFWYGAGVLINFGYNHIG